MTAGQPNTYPNTSGPQFGLTGSSSWIGQTEFSESCKRPSTLLTLVWAQLPFGTHLICHLASVLPFQPGETCTNSWLLFSLTSVRFTPLWWVRLGE